MISKTSSIMLLRLGFVTALPPPPLPFFSHNLAPSIPPLRHFRYFFCPIPLAPLAVALSSKKKNSPLSLRLPLFCLSPLASSQPPSLSNCRARALAPLTLLTASCDTASEALPLSAPHVCVCVCVRVCVCVCVCALTLNRVRA